MLLWKGVLWNVTPIMVMWCFGNLALLWTLAFCMWRWCRWVCLSRTMCKLYFFICYQGHIPVCGTWSSHNIQGPILRTMVQNFKWKQERDWRTYWDFNCVECRNRSSVDDMCDNRDWVLEVFIFIRLIRFELVILMAGNTWLDLLLEILLS